MKLIRNDILRLWKAISNNAKWTAAKHSKVDSIFLRVEAVQTKIKICAMYVYK